MRMTFVFQPSRGLVGKPENFRVKREELESVLITNAAELQGASSYELQIAEIDPTVKADSRQYAIFFQRFAS
jgi:hypothetical protein